jgi:hypothetical protein
LTTAYIKVCPYSRETLYEHISKCPVVGAGGSDRELAQVLKDKGFLRSTAYIESLPSEVARPCGLAREVSSGRALRHCWSTVSSPNNCLTVKAMPKDHSTSNTPAESPASALSDADLERLLNREASAIQRELEVDRILNAFKLKSVFVSSRSWAQFRVPISYCPTLQSL